MNPPHNFDGGVNQSINTDDDRNNMTGRRIVPNILIKNPRRMADSMLRVSNTDGGKSKPTSQSYTKPQGHPPKTLTRLIARRNWWEIECILSTTGSSDIGCIPIDEKGIITEDAILQFALRYHAPLHIIKLLALRYPTCLTRPDTTGKYACHVACKYGAMPNIIEYLVFKNRDAASVLCPAGKAPVHYLAEFYTSNNEAASVALVNENMLQAVRILREAAPKSFNLEDNEGYNAIELAIEKEVDIKIIKTMQRTARDDWRALKTSGHGKRHEELVDDVKRSANEARMNVVLGDVLTSSFRQEAGQSSIQDSSTKRAPLMNSFVAKSA